MSSGALAGADELYRHTGHVADRDRRAAARVAVELGQHDAGQVERLVEVAGRTDGVLAGHRVGDEERLARRRRPRLQPADLVHQRRRRRGDVPAVSIDHGVEARLRGRASGPPRARSRAAARLPSWSCTFRPAACADADELLDRRGAVDVGGDEVGVAAVLLQPGAELGRASSSCRSPAGRPSG